MDLDTILPGRELTSPAAYEFPERYLPEWFEKLCCDCPSAMDLVFTPLLLKWDACECMSSAMHPMVMEPRGEIAAAYAQKYFKMC